MSTPPPDDPFAPSEATILRPRPGRRPGGLPPGGPPPGGPPPPPGARPAPGPGGFEGNLRDFLTSTALNPLLQSAVPLLVLAGRLRGQIANADVESLSRQCIQEVRAFEERAKQAGVAGEDTLAARYVLCTVVDEAVLNTPWGAQSAWARQSLLVTFHREAAGGEKFFQILDRLLTEPQRYLSLLELFYACLALGFEGRYRLDPRGANKLAEVRQTLYTRIEGLRGGFEPALSPQWKGVEDRRNAVLRLIPLWVVAVACAALLVGAYIFFNERLSERSRTLNEALAKVGIETVSAAPSVPAPPSGLAAFLAPQISQHLVRVDEQGSRSLITITVPDLFASGSAHINPRYEALVHEIGAAVNRVPGRIGVIGHTDDQPVHSFLFRDNYELSHARAVQVADLLKHDVPDASRIEATGRGDSEPRYTPAATPENRARNRRVEIVHRRDN
jgi:type VI secretion system protein ImpK